MPRIQGVGSEGGKGDGLSPPAFASLVLAAGAGTRMGGTKSLVMLGRSTALELSHSRLLEACCGPVTVVVGAQHEEVMKRHVHLDVQWAVNEGWEGGMLSSVQCGLKSFSSLPDWVLLHLIDHARVEVATLTTLRNAVPASGSSIIQAVHQGKRGHPLLLHREVTEEIVSVDVSTRLDHALAKWRDKTLVIKLNDIYINHDFDVAADLNK